MLLMFSSCVATVAGLYGVVLALANQALRYRESRTDAATSAAEEYARRQRALADGTVTLLMPLDSTVAFDDLEMDDLHSGRDALLRDGAKEAARVVDRNAPAFQQDLDHGRRLPPAVGELKESPPPQSIELLDDAVPARRVQSSKREQRAGIANAYQPTWAAGDMRFADTNDDDSTIVRSRAAPQSSRLLLSGENVQPFGLLATVADPSQRRTRSASRDDGDAERRRAAAVLTAIEELLEGTSVSPHTRTAMAGDNGVLRARGATTDDDDELESLLLDSVANRI